MSSRFFVGRRDRREPGRPRPGGPGRSAAGGATSTPKVATSAPHQPAGTGDAARARVTTHVRGPPQRQPSELYGGQRGARRSAAGAVRAGRRLRWGAGARRPWWRRYASDGPDPQDGQSRGHDPAAATRVDRADAARRSFRRASGLPGAPPMSLGSFVTPNDWALAQGERRRLGTPSQDPAARKGPGQEVFTTTPTDAERSWTGRALALSGESRPSRRASKL